MHTVHALLTQKTNSHGGADFRSHTAAQIFALTRRRRFSPKFRPAHGDTDATPKILREKKIAGRRPAIFFFETVSVEQGFMTEKVFFMTEKVFRNCL